MRSDVTPGTGSKRYKRMRAIEAEFDEPFWDVVSGFAEMGYSRRATALAIGYNPSSFYYLAHSRTDIPWVPIGQAISRSLTPLSPNHKKSLHEGNRRRARRYHVLGQWLSVADLSAMAGISKDAIRKRIEKGITGDRLADPAMPHVSRGRFGAEIVNSRRSSRARRAA